MTYLVLEAGRVVSAHGTLPDARAAEPQGAGPSDEAGPLLDGEPAWWFRTWPDGDEAGLGIVRTQATALGVRFELRMCRAPERTCAHPGRTDCVIRAVSSSYGLLRGLAEFLPSAWIWAGVRAPDPRGETPEFRRQTEVLTERLAAGLRPVLRAVGEPARSTGTISARRESAHALVVEFLSRHFSPEPDRAEDVRILPVLDGAHLHLTLSPPAAGDTALCSTPIPAQRAEVRGLAGVVRPCDRCFGRSPIVPVPVRTAAEYDAWTAYLRTHSPGTP
ncbi:hypothetical protein [Streptomyces graminilatus]|uniref:hypothetical protein n=1 Tax=Streptomyces graminilatus TaxID=1464070 RepID=UPI0006E16A41|nr:hypothetical protein [Streptomyces graminilatus]